MVTPHTVATIHCLNGPVDTEISVPELVNEGDLCPHQDYVSNIENYIKAFISNKLSLFNGRYNIGLQRKGSNKDRKAPRVDVRFSHINPGKKILKNKDHPKRLDGPYSHHNLRYIPNIVLFAYPG